MSHPAHGVPRSEPPLLSDEAVNSLQNLLAAVSDLKEGIEEDRRRSPLDERLDTAYYRGDVIEGELTEEKRRLEREHGWTAPGEIVTNEYEDEIERLRRLPYSPLPDVGPFD